MQVSPPTILWKTTQSIVYLDKDGRDKWLNIFFTDERTGKTTQISILLSRELKSKEARVYTHPTIEDSYDWHDINLNFNITVDKNGKINSTLTQEEGKFRTNTWFNWEWKARVNIFDPSRKDPDIGDGFLLKGGDKGFGDPLSPSAKKIDVIDNADALLSMLGNWREFGAKIEPAELIKEIGGWAKVKKILESADNAMNGLSALDDAANIEVAHEIEPAETPKPSGKPVFIRDDNFGKEKKGSVQDHAYTRDTSVLRKPGKNNAPDTFHIKRKTPK